jgi:FAD/FMN-containing dehydrogenase
MEFRTVELTYTTEAVRKLQSEITGSAFTPNDPNYEQARHGWNLSVDQHPALILFPRIVRDVVAGVRFAREAGLGISVLTTGHGLKYAADGQLLIVTSRMTAVDVDPEARTARIEGGAMWKHVLEQSTGHGLAPLLGSSPHVGVVGYTLGGGIGWLARRYGLAADSVRSIDVVTADGVPRHTSPTENSDLFWGLLGGGGGSFGVVTAVEINLFPVATVYGGALMYPAGLVRDALRFYRDWVKTVPDELTSSIAVFHFPSVPQVPEALRGKIVVMMRAVYVGDADEGAAVIQPWLDWQTPASNTFHELPFSEIGTVSSDPVNPTAGFGSNELLNDLSDEAIDVIVHHMNDSVNPLPFTELRHAGGAIARVAPDANAIGNRNASFYFQIGGPTPTRQAYAAAESYVPRYKDAMRPYLAGGVYLNFMSGHEATARVKDAYLPAAYERLVALKAKYDPDNVFRFGYHLVP